VQGEIEAVHQTRAFDLDARYPDQKIKTPGGSTTVAAIAEEGALNLLLKITD